MKSHTLTGSRGNPWPAYAGPLGGPLGCHGMGLEYFLHPKHYIVPQLRFENIIGRMVSFIIKSIFVYSKNKNVILSLLNWRLYNRFSIKNSTLTRKVIDIHKTEIFETSNLKNFCPGFLRMIFYKIIRKLNPTVIQFNYNRSKLCHILQFFFKFTC